MMKNKELIQLITKHNIMLPYNQLIVLDRRGLIDICVYNKIYEKDGTMFDLLTADEFERLVRNYKFFTKNRIFKEIDIC